MPENKIPAPQFSTAEYSVPSSADTCKVCHQPISGKFYRADNAVVCGRCADRIKRETPQDSHAAFMRSLLFGLGGFAIGLAVYAGFEIATGISIGYLALAVGWIIGKAMMMGSGGIGARRYQITAVLLTYAAVSMASIPVAIHYMAQRAQAQPGPKAQTEQPAAQDPASQTSEESQGRSTAKAGSGKPRMSLAAALGTLAMIGLASPFLELQEGFSGMIGLVILLVGMQFAWKMTAARGNVVVTGPFEKSAAASA